MTQRERKLMGILLVVGVGLGGGLVGHLFLWQPLTELWSQNAQDEEDLQKKREELAKEERQIASIEKSNPRLMLWKQTSLPPKNPQVKVKPGVSPEEAKKRHLSQLQVEYERYLHELLRRSEFLADSITITARPPEKGSGPAAKGKEAVYDRLVFAVNGKAKLEGVVLMLHDFHRTNLLHQVRSIHVATQTKPVTGARVPVGRPAPQQILPELDVNMTVEALVVTGAEARSTLLGSSSTVKPRVLAEPIRSYRDLSARNMFLGVAKAAEEAIKITEDRKEVLRFVRVTTICNTGRRWEAYLYDLGKGGEEKRVNAVTVDEFSIYDQYENPVLSAKVVKVDERDLIIKVDGKYYRLQIGDFLYPAVEKPLSSKELKEMGISDS